MSTLLVIAHQRKDSLTAEIGRIFIDALESNDHNVEIADLVVEGFNPVMSPQDEPQWQQGGKLDRDCLSNDVRGEIARIERNSSAVLLFPIYWWSMPAILKGWIDRVWTYGFAYGGDNRIPLRRVWMIGVAGCDSTVYRDHEYGKSMVSQMTEGILGYCGVPDRRLIMLYSSMNSDNSAKIFAEAKSISRQFLS